MRRSWLGTRYIWVVALGGLSLWVGTVVKAAPWHAGASFLTGSTYQELFVLLALTTLSALSPIETRGGGSLSVTLAPLFGAVAVPLPPWAVMTIAALGTIDLRVPGKQIPWDRFVFNRGMFILAYGIPSLLVSGALLRDPGTTPFLLFLAAGLAIAINTSIMASSLSLLPGTGLVATIRTALGGNALTYLALPL